MSTPTLATLQTRLELYYAAEAKILESAQRYQVGGNAAQREVEQAKLETIAKRIDVLEQKIAALSSATGNSAETLVDLRRRGRCA